MKKIITLIPLVLLLFIAPCTLAQTTFVTVNGAGTQDGSSWANAKNGASLRSVLRNVPAFGNVWIAKGTYYPHPSSRDSSFFVRRNARVYGGFAGTETTIAQRNLVTNPTILSGDIGVPNDTADNSRHVVYLENVGDSMLLDGLTITLGNANGNYNSPTMMDAVGGGVVNFTNSNPGLDGISNPVFRNCRFVKNYAFLSGGGYCEYNFGNGVSRFYNCTFDANFCYNNGGAYSSYLLLGGNASPVFDSCRFVNNILDTSSAPLNSQGGAISLAKYGTNAEYTTPMLIRNCHFENNGAREGGAMATGAGYDITIENTTFKKNFGRITAAIISNNTLYHINHCTFDSNAAQSNVIWISTNLVNNIARHTRQFITNSVFRNNKAFFSIENYTGTFLNAQRPSDTTYITNCLFENDGRYGCIRSIGHPGGNSYTHLNNLTIWGDAANMEQKSFYRQISNFAYNPSGPIGFGTSRMYINNSIIWYPSFLTAGERSVKNGIEGQGSGAVVSTQISRTIFRTSNGAWPADGGTDAGGNLINVNPLFIDSLSDFRLRCGSPAVNSGLNTAFPYSVSATDIEGNSRIINTNIDRGCYEQLYPVIDLHPALAIHNDTITMHISSSYGIDSIHWDLGDGTTGNSAAVNHIYAASGTYHICIWIETPCGNKDTCFDVQISKPPPVVGISGRNIAGAVRVYPNPVVDHIRIDVADGHRPLAVKISDLAGRIVKEWGDYTPQTLLQVGDLPVGIYMLRVVDGQGAASTCKIVKQ